jgi:hypothetical protein
LRPADLLPRFLLPPAGALAGGLPGDEEIRRATGLSRDRWRELGRALPVLGRDPGRSAARARRRLDFLVGRALGNARHGPVWRGAPVEPRPTVFVTGHIGDLRGLRLFLRRRLPAASVVSEEGRRQGTTEDPFTAGDDGFPHVLSAASAHRLRAALRRGSLIAAVDVAAPGGRRVSLLGGAISVDARPIRLARIARVPCRPLFLTAPRGRLTVTAAAPVREDDPGAIEDFARAFDRVARESPHELDGVTHWEQLS